MNNPQRMLRIVNREERVLSSPQDNVHRNFGGECVPGDVAPYVVLPTSAQQVEKIVQRWDTARKVTHHYEFLIYTGEVAGVPITACSTGIGGMSVSIAMEELAALGARSFLHVGLAEPLHQDPEASMGLLTIAKGAVRADGTSGDYVRPEYPAVAHFEVVMAAITAAQQRRLPYRVGVVASQPPFPLRSSSWPHRLVQQAVHPTQQALARARVLGGSGEEASIFIQASLYGFRAGSITACPTTPTREVFDPEVEDSALEACVETIRVLALWDDEKLQRGQSHIVPSV